MNEQSPTNRFGSFFYWILESLGMRQDLKGEKSRLAHLGAKHHHEVAPPERAAVPESTPINALEGDKDNYLRGMLFHENHDAAERHNRRTVETWLHGDALDCSAKEGGAGGDSRDYDYRPMENQRLVDTAEINLGMDMIDSLNCFMHSCDKDLHDKGESRLPNSMKTTVQDVPAVQLDFKRVELIHADAANRQVKTRE